MEVPLRRAAHLSETIGPIKAYLDRVTASREAHRDLAALRSPECAANRYRKGFWQSFVRLLRPKNLMKVLLRRAAHLSEPIGPIKASLDRVTTSREAHRGLAGLRSPDCRGKSLREGLLTELCAAIAA